jgi:hypothetical protein
MAVNPNEVVNKNAPGKGAANEQKEGPGEEKKGISRWARMKGLVAGLAIVATFGLGHAACSEDSANPPPIPDSGLDAGDTDTVTDSGTDTDTGTDSDTTTDSGTDTDTVTDSDTDTTTDTDTGTDTGTDTEVDGGTDAGPVACTEASTGEFSDVMNLGVPQEVGGYVFVYTGQNSSGDALIDITCGGNAVETGYVCPVYTKTTLEVTIDGKKIEITPHQTNPAWSDIRVDVMNL